MHTLLLLAPHLGFSCQLKQITQMPSKLEKGVHVGTCAVSRLVIT